MLQKCKCQKSKYLTNRCSCRRTENKRCSNLCQCVDCQNIEEGSVADVEIEYPLDDADNESTGDAADYELPDTEIDAEDEIEEADID